MLPDSGNYAMIKVTAGYSSNTKPFSMDSMLKIMKKMGVDVKESGTEKLGPYKAYWVMGKDFQDVWQYMYYLFAGKNIYLITAGGYETYFNAHKEELRMMLRSFKPKG
jgi:hypothetical protein